MLYISHFSHFSCNSTVSLAEIKTAIRALDNSVKLRRLDRLSLVSLAGALQNDSALDYHEHNNLYLFSVYQSVDNMETLLTQIYVNQESLKPYNFINSVSNAATFYVAKALSIHNRNLFLADDKTVNSLVKACLLARSDLKRFPDSSVTVGFVSASRESAEEITAEDSFWLTLSAKPDNALACIDVETLIKQPINEGNQLATLNLYEFLGQLRAELMNEDDVTSGDKILDNPLAPLMIKRLG